MKLPGPEFGAGGMTDGGLDGLTWGCGWLLGMFIVLPMLLVKLGLIISEIAPPAKAFNTTF